MLTTPFITFLASLAFFHCSEFLLAYAFMRHELSLSSWLVSKPYAVAMAFALFEYWLESWLLPGWKIGSGGMGYLAWSGLALVLLGEGIRKLGMFTAGGNFTHNIRTERHPAHSL
ncbi:hypothetical protein Agub_g15148, partial [Astrephomene gubernaculifera]